MPNPAAGALLCCYGTPRCEKQQAAVAAGSNLEAHYRLPYCGQLLRGSSTLPHLLVLPNNLQKAAASSRLGTDVVCLAKQATQGGPEALATQQLQIPADTR